MKKLISILLSISILLCFTIPAYANAEISVMVNEEKLTFDVPPQTINDRTMVPVRAIFEALGAKVEWIEETQTVESSMGDTTVIITINSNNMLVNGGEIFLDSPACIINGRTLVPVRAIAEAYGAKVDWHEESQTVFITTKDKIVNQRYADVTANINQIKDMINRGLYTEAMIECDALFNYTLSPNDKTVASDLRKTAETKYKEYIASVPPTISSTLSAPLQTSAEWKSILGFGDNHVYLGKNFRLTYNSAGGLYLWWGARNTSLKTIKYLTFTAEFINPVGDPAYDDITRESSKTIQLIGPINPGEGFIYRKIIGYSSSCSNVRISNVTIDFMDGTSISGEYGHTTEMLTDNGKAPEKFIIR